MVRAIPQEIERLALDPVLEAYRDALASLATPAWLLRAQRDEEITSIVSQIGGGTPFVPATDGWPRCRGCTQRLSFLCQVDFSGITGVATYAWTGMFQVFYCWSCFPFSAADPGYRTRWHPHFNSNTAASVPLMRAPSDVEVTIPTHRLDVQAIVSLPDVLTSENPIPEDLLKASVNDPNGLWQRYRALLPPEAISQLGGYPRWLQPSEGTPLCAVCGKRMELVLSIGSLDSALLGEDEGSWYFFACQATIACAGLDAPVMTSQMELRSIVIGDSIIG